MDVVGAVIASVAVVASLSISFVALSRSTTVQRRLDQVTVSNLLAETTREVIAAVGRGERLQFRSDMIVRELQDEVDRLGIEAPAEVADGLSRSQQTLAMALEQTRQYEESLVDLQRVHADGSAAPEGTVERIQLWRSNTAKVITQMDGIDESLNSWRASLEYVQRRTE